MRLGLLVLLSLLFATTHLGLSHGILRERLVARLGLWAFRAVYSVISLVTAGWAAVLFWNHRHLGPLLWDLPDGVVLAVALPLMLFAVVLLVLSLGTPSPTGMIPTRTRPFGVLRITRHPMNMAFAAFGLAHLVANGFLGDVAFFGSIFFVGLVGAYHQDRRKDRELGEPFQVFRQQTAVLPFAAVLRGKTRLEADEFPVPLLVVGLVVFVVLAVLHGRLFGAPLFV